MLFLNCSTITTNEHTIKTYSITVNTLLLPKSKELIDKTPTYELYFNLAENTQCIDVTVIAEDKNEKRVRCAFILESKVDLSYYTSKPLKPVYTEIARNYDFNWRMQTTVNVCTSATDPLKKLNKGSYRLRISAFSGNYFTFTIDISSPVPVEFIQ